MEVIDITIFEQINALGLASVLDKKGRLVTDGLVGPSLLLVSKFLTKPENVAVVAPNQYAAQKIYEFLLNFLPEEEAVFFPSDELLRAEAVSASRELMAQRLYAMHKAVLPRPKILVTHPSALLRHLNDPQVFLELTIEVSKGDRVSIEELKEKLTTLGYQRVSKVDQPLQFAIRGDIVDIFSVNGNDPVRIEFFDDEIEAIREFSVETQSSFRELDELTILPATDLFLTDGQITAFSNLIDERLKAASESLEREAYEKLESETLRSLETVVAREHSPSSYRYYRLAVGAKPFSIIDYLKPGLVLITDRDAFEESSALLFEETGEYYRELSGSLKQINGLFHYMEIDEALKSAKSLKAVSRFLEKPSDDVFSARPAVSSGSGLSAMGPTIKSYLSSNDKLVLALPDPNHRSMVSAFLKEEGLEFEETEGLSLPRGRIAISPFALSDGFELLDLKVVFLSANELFGRRGKSSRFSSRFKNATILKSHQELRPGDYVVHEYKGIGRFLEIKTLEVEGIHRDYLHIAYAGDETLYVPLEQFRLVRKYAGREGAAPRLSRLSGNDWSKKKKQIKERINELADRLYALYKERVVVSGHAFPEDDEFQEAFENRFPYELTADQKKALEEIKKDMEQPIIMDRLLCGDVGFGKTEIAFRAAFKALYGGKQVAILCPTTLLARQHYEVAIERFNGTGTHVGHLSRLVSNPEQKRVIAGIEDGSLNLIIGTHRLLSKEVKFKNLGFLIVDEEQRFGVEQKEKIKELRRNVDVLTLSATPIPRTLQMSLLGIRPLSEINTAPPTRMPIQTYVTPYKDEIVAELINRELARDGQVFFVHNKVYNIYETANRLARLSPNAAIGVVHGKMEKDEIEEVMSKFYDGEVKVLVATSIVENGIDVPRANMIIVEDADRFGLSQLYQIKGRVGRGDRIAYAYLMYRAHKSMSEDAQKRLSAIQEFTELGSGYKIAQRDLMIRGAGDILGPEQAGFIDTVGLDLYLQMLSEAVEERKTGVAVEPVKETPVFSIDAYIPADYAPLADKIEMYHEIQGAKDEKALMAYRGHLRDMYGRLPKETELLFQKKRIDLIREGIEFSSLAEEGGIVDIILSDAFSRESGIGIALFNALGDLTSITKVNFLNRKLRIQLTKGKRWLDDLERLVKTIHGVYENHLLSRTGRM